MTKQEAIEEEAEKLYPTPNPYVMGLDIGNSMKRESFIKGANWYKENESKKEIDFAKLMDEFFDECTELHTEFEGGKVFSKKVITFAPHDLFEWFKNKLQ